MMGAFVVLSRIEETIADYHAIWELGEERFMEAYEEIASVSDDSLLNQVLLRVQYTRSTHTLGIYRLFQRPAKT